MTDPPNRFTVFKSMIHSNIGVFNPLLVVKNLITSVSHGGRMHCAFDVIYLPVFRKNALVKWDFFSIVFLAKWLTAFGLLIHSIEFVISKFFTL